MLATNKNIYYVMGLVLATIIALLEARGEGDFKIFSMAATDLMSHKNIYTQNYMGGFHYYYDTSFALILYPFTFLPFYIAKFIWLLFNLHLVYRISKLILHYIPYSNLSMPNKIGFFIIASLFALRFIRDNIHLAQLTILILYLCLEGIYCIQHKKTIVGAALIGLGISIKILPLVLLPYLLFRKEFKAVLYIAFTVLLLLFIPGLLIGWEYNQFLLHERWKLINPTNTEHVFDTAERSFHSLTTFLTTLLVENCNDYYALPVKRNILDLSIEQLNIVVNAVRICFVLFTLYFLKWTWFRPASSKLSGFYEMSYILAIIPLIFPHQQHYAFLLITPATTYLGYYFITCYFDDKKQILKPLVFQKVLYGFFLFLAFILTSSHFILGQYRDYYDHFKTLTYGALIVIALLAVSAPKKIAQS